VKRREFGTLIVGFLGSVALGPAGARAQGQPIQLQPGQGQPGPNQGDPNQADDDQIGQVATLQGSATVTRTGAPAAALQANDGIYKGDVLATGANSALGVTFDDETTFSLTANARIVIDEYVYQEGAKGNSAIFNVTRGTVAFVASAVAKDGDMKITTPTASLGIRGTTGVVDVPSSAAGGGESKIKLYPDADGRVGQIEVFNRQGGRLGALTQGSSAFALRGLGGRLAAVPFAIPPQEAARDRGVVQRLFASHAVGRRLATQRRQLRGPNFRRPNNLRPGQQRNNLRPNNLRPGQQPNRGFGPQQPNRNPGGQQPGGLRQRLQKLNPFAPKKKDIPPPR
jgi:FecR protein